MFCLNQCLLRSFHFSWISIHSTKISSFWIRRYYVLVVQNAVSKTRMKNCHNPKRTPWSNLNLHLKRSTSCWRQAPPPKMEKPPPLHTVFDFAQTRKCCHNLGAWHRITTIDQKHRDKLPILVVLWHIAVVHKIWSQHKESRFKLGESATASNQFQSQDWTQPSWQAAVIPTRTIQKDLQHSRDISISESGFSFCWVPFYLWHRIISCHNKAMEHLAIYTSIGTKRVPFCAFWRFFQRPLSSVYAIGSPFGSTSADDAARKM